MHFESLFKMLGPISHTESMTWRHGGPVGITFQRVAVVMVMRQARVNAGRTSCRQRYHFVSSQPSQPARSFGLRIGPPCNPVRRHQFGDHAAPFQFACDLCPELRVPFRPRGQMIAGRKPVAFLAVTPAIREHEVVAQVYRIPSPGDEVIDVGGRWRKRCVTVEALAPLDIEQDGAYDG